MPDPADDTEDWPKCPFCGIVTPVPCDTPPAMLCGPASEYLLAEQANQARKGPSSE